MNVMEKPTTRTPVKQQPSQQPSLGYDILRSCIFYARKKCLLLLVFVALLICPFMNLAYNVINLAILFSMFWYPEYLVEILFMTFEPTFSFIFVVFKKYLRTLALVLYRSVLEPVMPVIVDIVGHIAQVIVNIALPTFQKLGFKIILRTTIFILVLILFLFVNVLIYTIIHIPLKFFVG